jgi:MFS family permease
MDALDATTLAQVSGVSHLLTLDTTPWYKKRNLRSLYLCLVPAAFSIGAAVALPAVPWTNDRLGRKLSIVIGSCIIVAGVILQTASVNSMSLF